MIHRVPDALRAFLALIITTTWTALLLADLGAFHAWIPLGAGLLAFGGLWVAGKSDYASGFSMGWPEGVVALAVVVSFVLTLPPSEMILGGWDPGVYLHAAAGVAGEGSLHFHHPDLAEMTRSESSLLSRRVFRTLEPFGGMRVLPSGEISPQFHHAYPALMGVAYGLGGMWAALWVNPVLHAGCIVALFALACQFMDRRWAVVVTLVFAFQPAEVWQAKFSTAEIAGQLFLLSGLAMWASFQQARAPRRFGPILAGAALGMALLTRYDTLLLLAPFVVLFVLLHQRLEWRRESWWMLGAFGLAIVHMELRRRFVAPYYQPLSGIVGPGLVASALVVAGFFLVSRFARPGWRARMVSLAGWVRWFLASLFTGWMLFAWLLRPGLRNQPWDANAVGKVLHSLGFDSVYSFLAGAESHDAIYLKTALGSVVFVLGIVGIVLLILHAKRAWQVTVVYPLVAVTVLLSAHIFHDHFLMWLARRFVPVAIPLFCLAVGYAGHAIATRWLRGPRMQGVFAVVLVAAVMVPQRDILALVSRERDWPGLIEWYEQLVPEIPPDALVYSDQAGFAAPLRFLYRRKAYELHFANEERRMGLYRIMREKVDAGEEVYFLTSREHPRVGDLYLQPVVEARLKTRILAQQRQLPRGTKARGGAFVLYRARIVPAWQSLSHEPPRTLPTIDYSS